MHIVLAVFYATAVFFYGIYKAIDTVATVMIMALRSRDEAPQT